MKQRVTTGQQLLPGTKVTDDNRIHTYCNAVRSPWHFSSSGCDSDCLPKARFSFGGVIEVLQRGRRP